MPKELKLIITFHTIDAAINLEQGCKKESVGGRLIPVPRQLSAGCGFAWMSELDNRSQLEAVIHKFDITIEAITELEL